MTTPDEARPSDDVLVGGAAITSWLYVDVALTEMERRMIFSVRTAVAEIRAQMRKELRGPQPFSQLIAAADKVKTEEAPDAA